MANRAKRKRLWQREVNPIPYDHRFLFMEQSEMEKGTSSNFNGRYTDTWNYTFSLLNWDSVLWLKVTRKLFVYWRMTKKISQVLQSFLTQPAPREWVSKDSGRQSKDALWSHIMSCVCSIQRLPNYLIFIECCHMSGTALVLRIQQQTRQISTILGIGYYRENGMQTDKKWLYK